MKSTLIILNLALLLPILCFAQPLWQDNFEDGNYTANPPWFYYSGGVQMSQFGGDWCLEVFYATPPVDSSGIIFTGIPQTQEFTLEFDLHRRWQTGWQNNICIGFTAGPFVPGTGFQFMENDLNNLQLRWNGQTVSQVSIPGMQYDWIHVVMHRSPQGQWQVTWDEGGPHQTTISGQDQFGMLTNPHLYIECDGWYSQQRGAYFDNFVMSGTPGGYPGEFVVDDHTAALWHFNENAGTIAHDATAHNYDMSLQDGAGWHAPGWNNTPSAVNLTDPDAKVNSNYTVGNGWDAITLEAWINPTQIGPYTGWFCDHPIITRQEFHNVSDCSYFLYLTAQGQIYAGVNLNSPGGPVSQALTEQNLIQVNTWYHVAATWSSGEPLRIFINDMDNPVEVSSDPVVPGVIRTGTDALRIGCNWTVEYYNEWEYFHGYIDEARISDMDRYPVQPGGPPFTPDEFTQGLWHFNETPGTYVAFDASGYGYNLSLQDGATFTPAGHFAGAVDLTDPDAKVNSAWLVGNGWEALTIDAFIYPTELAGSERPIVERYRWYASDPSYFLTVMENGQLYGGVYVGTSGPTHSTVTTAPGVIEVNNWYHVALTWSSGEPARIFLNGELIGTSEEIYTGSIRAGDDPLTVGWFHDEGYGNFYFQGKIDEVRLSNIVRYEAQPPPPPPPICFEEHWNDGNWTVNPTWYEYQNQPNGFAINNGWGHVAPPALEGWGDPQATDYVALYTPVNCSPEITADFWVHKRTPTYSIIDLGFSSGPYSSTNLGFRMKVNQNNMTGNWEFIIVDGTPGTILFNQVIQYDSDRWINIHASRTADGDWTIFWDFNGPDQTVANVNDSFTSFTNVHLWVSPQGYYSVTGGFYLDDIVIISPEPPSGPVQIALTPLNPPILIPQNGGSFSFHTTITNTTSTTQLCDIWSYLQLPPPGGLVPSMGPIALNLAPNSSMTRLRTQVVPASAPAGNYLYWGSVGDYPWNVMQTVNFPFAKAGVDNGGNALEGWLCTGEPFPGEGLAADDLPAKYALHLAFPNPFNPATIIRYQIPDARQVNLQVYDIAGKLVATLVDGWREAGEHQVTFDGAGLPSGLYLYRLQADGQTTGGKMVLIK